MVLVLLLVRVLLEGWKKAGSGSANANWSSEVSINDKEEEEEEEEVAMLVFMIYEYLLYWTDVSVYYNMYYLFWVYLYNVL